MAKIHWKSYPYDGGVQYQSTWQGIGWDKIPSEWLFYASNEFKWVATLGKIRLRILKTCGWDLYVVQENWRWPIWWAILRVWLALCWFEGNLRMTAAIWEILHRPEPGCTPLWSDFVILHLLRGLVSNVSIEAGSGGGDKG